jgi:preprotein translocase subunit Sss1
MFGILLLIVFLCVMGFILALIHNMLSDDELEVKRAILILFLTGVVGFIIKVALQDNDPNEAALAGVVAQFITLTLLLKLMAYVPIPKALLIALIYSIVAFLFGLFLSYMLMPATPA